MGLIFVDFTRNSPVAAAQDGSAPRKTSGPPESDMLRQSASLWLFIGWGKGL
jgi:hypothetical protein